MLIQCATPYQPTGGLAVGDLQVAPPQGAKSILVRVGLMEAGGAATGSVGVNWGPAGQLSTAPLLPPQVSSPDSAGSALAASLAAVVSALLLASLN
jgi:hypothetical protein